MTESADRVVTLVLRTQNGVISNFDTKAGSSVSCFFSIPSGIFLDVNSNVFLLHPLQFIIHSSFQPLLSESLVKRDVNK